MKIAFLAVFEVPETGEFDLSEAGRREMRDKLESVLRRNTGRKAEVAVLPHILTPAELAALP